MKRFLSYEFVQRLRKAEHTDVFEELAKGVNNTDNHRGKLHQVFKPSFDSKECFSAVMKRAKLNYMPARPVSGGQSLWRRHAGGYENSCRGEWQIADSPEGYNHNAALL